MRRCQYESRTATQQGLSFPKWSWLVVCALALSLAGLAAPTWAQTAPSPRVDDLQDVVVTAEKRASTVQDTAISLTAVTGEELQSHGIASVEDLIATVPGISMRTAAPGSSEYEIRGLTSSGGSAATVGFYLDDIPLSASAVSLYGRTVVDPDLFDLGHVEVLRGPQGTLYGSGSMGGTIRLVTNPPKLGAYEASTAVSISHTGSGGATNGSGSFMFNVPLGDTAAFRFVATDKYISGWVPRFVVAQGQFPYPVNFNCGAYFCDPGNLAGAPVAQTIPHSNNERFASMRAELLWKPNDTLSVQTNLMYQRLDMDGYPAYQATGRTVNPYPATPGFYQPVNVQEPHYDAFKLAAVTVKYDLGFAELTSATGYWDRLAVEAQDSTQAMQNIFNIGQYQSSGVPANCTSPTQAGCTGFLPGNLYTETDPTTQFSEELRLTSSGTSKLQWVTGLYFAKLDSGYLTTHQSLAMANALACPAGSNGPNCQYGLGAGTGGMYNINFPFDGNPANNPNGVVFNDNNPNVMKQSAVFGEATYKFSEQWKLTAGLRYFKFDVANTALQCGVGTATGNASCTTGSASGKGSAVLPKLNLAYQPTGDLNLYGTISKGSRPGGVNLPIPLTAGALYFCGPGSGPSYLDTQPAYYQPDSIWSYELGEKFRWDDRRFSLNADVFYVSWKNLQQVVALSCGYPYNTNVGNAESYGPEVEFSARITPALRLNLSGTYTEAKITQAIPTGNGSTNLASGTPILSVPKYTLMGSLDYTHSLANHMVATFHLADSMVGPMTDIDFYQNVPIPSHNIVDGRAGLMRDKWAVYLTATNLTNKVAALTTNNTTFAWQQPTIARVSTNQPRTIGLDLQYKF